MSPVQTCVHVAKIFQLLTMPVLAAGLWLAVFLPGAGAAENALGGRLLESVACKADPAQRYALYVPGGYTPERVWPVVFCFDPSARGLVPVERLRAAAEKHGYIVAGSLNSRNGPFPENLAAAQAMVRDVRAHLSVDPQRVYTLGMSGGARVAATLGLGGMAKGVVLCGAGFPQSEEGVPKTVAFPVFGIVGLEDYNLPELRRLEAELSKRGAAQRFVTFDGPHVWPPEAELGEALAWLRLQAMKTGAEAVDEAFVRGEFARRSGGAEAATVLESWRAWKAVTADFSGLVDVKAVEARAVALGKSAAVKKALNEEEARFFRETLMLEQMSDAAAGAPTAKRRVAEKLRAKMESAESVEERQSVRRAVLGYCAATQPAARALIENNEYPHAIALLEMVTELQPDHARSWVDLARALALDGDVRAALAALGKAEAAGFGDAEFLEREQAFKRLREDEGFRAVVAKIRARGVETLPKQ
jgi:dienelactone hydrolase